MRALVLAFPRDPRAAAREDEFLFGADLLAAPVIGPGTQPRRLYLPRGRWLDARQGLRYDAPPETAPSMPGRPIRCAGVGSWWRAPSSTSCRCSCAPAP